MLSSVYLAAEDEPGLAVGRKLIAEAPPLWVHTEKNGHGYGHLKNRTPNYQQMGERGLPVLMLTDLDDDLCPSHKVQEWLGATPSAGFLLRICVREIEAWLLAHQSAMASFLGVAPSHVPINPELLIDAKRALIAVAQRSKYRTIRVGFKPIGSATIGPDYNQLLNRYIRESWDASVASQTAPSLARACQRLKQLAVLVAE